MVWPHPITRDDWRARGSSEYYSIWGVAPAFACPYCGNRDPDRLVTQVWGDGNDVHCSLCGVWYKIEDNA